ncbi:MAG: triose-phosphate isomerase [Sphaerochaetaceae bacterium]|jgi:triosephosphate isomerase
MYEQFGLKAPFFEIGPKNYVYGDDVLEMALVADDISKRYNVDIIFTTPFTEIRRIAEQTKNLYIIAPHIDPIPVGRGLADILAEGVKAAGAHGVMLNHAEKPISYDSIKKCIDRANEVGLGTIVCANTVIESQAIALLEPNVIVAEPTELIGTGQTSDMAYVKTSIEAIKSVNKNIFVLQGAGISNGNDVYNVIYHGAEATGSSSGIMKAKDPFAMIEEMVQAVRKAWDDRT